MYFCEYLCLRADEPAHALCLMYICAAKVHPSNRAGFPHPSVSLGVQDKELTLGSRPPGSSVCVCLSQWLSLCVSLCLCTSACPGRCLRMQRSKRGGRQVFKLLTCSQEERFKIQLNNNLPSKFCTAVNRLWCTDTNLGAKINRLT